MPDQTGTRDLYPKNLAQVQPQIYLSILQFNISKYTHKSHAPFWQTTKLHGSIVMLFVQLSVL
jgi:hypothetical protein